MAIIDIILALFVIAVVCVGVAFLIQLAIIGVIVIAATLGAIFSRIFHPGRWYEHNV